MYLSDFTYFVNTSAEVQVYPEQPPDFDLIFEERYDDDLAVYVRELGTEFVLAGTDYDLLYDNYEVSGACDRLPFTIRHKGSDYYTGTLDIGTDRLNWDRSNCKLIASVAPSGSYRCLQDNWESEFNMYDGVTEIEVETFLGALSESTCGPVSGVAAIEVMGFFETNVTGCIAVGGPSAYGIKRAYIEEITPGSHYDHYATWVSEIATVTCTGGSPTPPAGDGWVLFAFICPGTSTWGRKPQLIYEGEFSAESGKHWDNRYLVAGADVSSYDNGVLLNDVLEENNPCTSLNIVSDFYGINPSGDAPSNDAYTEAGDNLQYVTIFQKTDIKRPAAVENATIGSWTYKSLLNHLRTLHNVRWQIVGNDFRIEHVSFFSGGAGLDLVADHSNDIAGLHQYTRSLEGIARFENFTFMEAVSNLFTARRIEYEDCAGDRSEEELPNVADQANNDIGQIQAYPDQASEDGFVFVSAGLSSGTYYIISEQSAIATDIVLNGHMSWPNLMANYHKWARPLPTGRLNNILTTFESSVPRKEQTTIRITITREAYLSFDPTDLITSQMGAGELISATYSARTCTLTINLRHE